MVKALPTRREYSADRATAASEQTRNDLTQALSQNPFLQGKLISVRLGVTTPKAITHGLGVPAAFIIARQNYNGSGIAAQVGLNGPTYQSVLDQRQQLSIYADIACDVDLWFYPLASKAIDSHLGQSK